MNIIDIHRKYQIRFSASEVEALMRILTCYIEIHSNSTNVSISSYGQIIRTIRIGQRLQSKLFKLRTMNKGRASITFDTSEAGTLIDIFEDMNRRALGDLERTVIYNIYTAITTKM